MYCPVLRCHHISAEGIEGMQEEKMANSRAKDSKERSSKPIGGKEGKGASAGEDSGEWLDMGQPLGNEQPQRQSESIRLRYSVKCKPKKEQASRKMRTSFRMVVGACGTAKSATIGRVGLYRGRGSC
jgi:hypothetical protein